ncbi:MAG TPA: hypothetical protein VK135_03665 [Candidatus Dormibacteraeota bacterium]|nr:hypothetical protein [Candidatus Dormibacteraeota bacterium]
MSKEKNIDICVLVDVNAQKNLMTVYSPLEQKNIVVNITNDVLKDIPVNEAVAFEIDLESKTIVE